MASSTRPSASSLLSAETGADSEGTSGINKMIDSFLTETIVLTNDLHHRTIVQRLGISRSQRDQSIFRHPCGNFHLGEIRDGSLHVAALQFVVDDLVDVRLAIVQTDGLARYGEDIAMFRGNNCDAHVDVREKLEVAVVHDTGRLPDVTSAMKFYDGRDHTDCALPGSLGHRVPGYFDSLSRGEASDIGLVHEGSHPDFGEVRLLQNQIAGIEVSARQNGQRVDDSIER